MNTIGQGLNVWRRRRKRGVSPIIATILLVAITVVLAAVLYVLISGLTGSGTSAPVALGLDQLPSETGGTGTTWYVAVALNPTSSIATTGFGLKVTTTSATYPLAAAVGGGGCTVAAAYTSGTTCTGVTGKWYGVLTNATGNIVATYTSATTSGWSTSITITGGAYTFYVISASVLDGQGYTLSGYGTGAASISGSAFL